ncbi:Ig-like domain-containing protein [Gilvimarinus sp. SDUM040013]|uniref:Ig-like domain-containing protein n=1 Tax=Gilvimarinus gilvus TaxID=3058038 RepID=A0ABU4S2U2_9GAMM|nr:Ig-like domain-containing protein [Gilvimarinus sp. SDUM040013]MDO3384950.1 Ig-like domain-containing protein [Gilvimarinus sp. SDUM040013]MDX6851254.1 Ig-like domain-containing protein [Gilvimarinus sp. SDUM040013]
MMNLITRSPLRWLAQVTALFSILVMSACGGGSSGTTSDGPSDPDTIKQEQPTLYFSQSIVVMDFGETPLENQLLGGAGQGLVTYSSSDVDVAAVNERTGRLDIRKSGSTTISAVKAADANNFSAQATYVLTIAVAAQEPLVFAHNSIEQYIDEEPVVNTLSGGSGTVETVYSSSDPSVVSVNAATGALTFVDDGTASITAYRPADERYDETSASYTISISKYPQEPLNFALTDIEGAIGFAPEENSLSGGSGNGEVVFSSQDPSIATVASDTGLVTLVSSGSTDITATKLDDDYYQATSTSYTINAYDIVGELEIDAGLTDTQIQWASQSGSINVQRSRFATCEPGVISGCYDYSLQIFANADEVPYLDTYPRIDRTAYLQFSNDRYESEPLLVAPTEQPFLPTTGNSLLFVEGMYWSLGGATNGTVNDEVWFSSNGAQWQALPFTLAQAARDLSAVVFNNEVYIGGGWNEGYLHTIWKLTDTGWQQVADPQIATDTSSHLVVYNDSLWLVSSAGIWHSSDGNQWSLLTDAPAFSARNNFTVFTFHDQLYLLGGIALDGSDALLQDVWHSANGSDWQLLSASAGFPPQSHAKVVLHYDSLYLLGGNTGVTNAEVYWSDDANSWALAGSADVGDLTDAAVGLDDNGLIMTSPQSSYFWRSSDAFVWRTPVNAQLQWLEK